ncbi:MAG: hypothetical protein QHH10_11650 [Peptococcaceae bacterium]|nr:hypothetical protein [Peptococcaceae bacterium]MDH7525956.1 hypothetical protein [Peptococcaceae bacterium]
MKKIVSINLKDTGEIYVFFPYDLAYIEKIKTVRGYRWDQDQKCWVFKEGKASSRK